MAHWTEKRSTTALLGRELRALGWELLGWKEDRSDSMTDYYDPESWGGVGLKDGADGVGCVVCVNVSSYDVNTYSGKGIAKQAPPTLGPCTSCKGTGKRQHASLASVTYSPLEGMREVSREESKPAGSPCDVCEGTGQREESRGVVYPDPWPTFQANPGRSSWHVERDGRIVAKGSGVFTIESESVAEWVCARHGAYGAKAQGAGVSGPAEGRPECPRCGIPGELRRRYPKAQALARKIDDAATDAGMNARPMVGRSASRAHRRMTEGLGETREAGAEGWRLEPSSTGRAGVVEVHFPAKPDDATRAELKAAGFRWAKRNACWYGPAAKLPERYRSGLAALESDLEARATAAYCDAQAEAEYNRGRGGY